MRVWVVLLFTLMAGVAAMPTAPPVDNAAIEFAHANVPESAAFSDDESCNEDCSNCSTCAHSCSHCSTAPSALAASPLVDLDAAAPRRASAIMIASPPTSPSPTYRPPRA